MKSIISVQGLGKNYVIRHEGSSYRSLREELFKFPSKILGRNSPQQEDFWALKNVSFEVNPGERVGIIGRNGAGKSTLLKIISRITEPKTGRITLRGRVASLLEVGTGFHPELTGRENVYLNGAILGMSRIEVRNKFDEIVNFSGVEKFLDTPVKRYSSGMYVRLAFAVAAHLEPEILIVDEVLAVGDVSFQNKCLAKMQQVGKEGRTVLFVSHQMSAIKQLCTRGILLENGMVRHDSNPVEVISAYADEHEDEIPDNKNFENQPFDVTMRYESICFVQNGRQINKQVFGDQNLEALVTYWILEETIGFRLYLDILDEYDTVLLRLFNDCDEKDVKIYKPGRYLSKVIIPKGLLGPKQYKFVFKAGIYNIRTCSYQDGLRFILKVSYLEGFAGPYPADTFRASINSQLPWKTTLLDT